VNGLEGHALPAGLERGDRWSLSADGSAAGRWAVAGQSTPVRVATLTSLDTPADRHPAARLAEAERALTTTVERMARVKNDYLDGKLSADDYAEFGPRVEAEHAAAEAEMTQLRAHSGELAQALGSDDLETAVGQVTERIGEVLAGSERIEHARAVIRSIWPKVTVHHNGNQQIRLETGPVAAGFARALCATTNYAGLPGGSSHSPES